MPYQIQAKAVERRFNRTKFLLSALKNIIAVATTVLPTILSALDNSPKNKRLLIIISSIGYVGYLSKQIFEFVENEALRTNVSQYQQAFRQLIDNYNGRHQDPLDQVTIAPTWSHNANGFILFAPTVNNIKMFGARPTEWRALTLTIIQFFLITAAFIISIIQESINSNAHISSWDVLLPLILGGIGAIFDPITEHLTKGNLIRAKDVYQDAIYSFYRPVISPAVAAIEGDPHQNKTLRRIGELKRGLTETFFIDKTSGRNNNSINIDMSAQQMPQLKVNPNRYRFFTVPNSNPVFDPMVSRIVEIIQINPIFQSDPTNNPVTLNSQETALINRP